MQVAVGQLEWVQQCIHEAQGPFNQPFGKHLKPQASRTVVWVGAEGVGLLGWLSFSDTLRSDAVDVVQRLQRMGMGVLLLSGDAPNAVARIASEVGIPAQSRCCCCLLPLMCRMVRHSQAIHCRHGNAWCASRKDGCRQAALGRRLSCVYHLRALKGTGVQQHAFSPTHVHKNRPDHPL